MKINNIPEWAKNKDYIVFRMVDGEAWFYDAWKDYKSALEVALEVGGQIVPIEEVSFLEV